MCTRCVTTLAVDFVWGKFLLLLINYSSTKKFPRWENGSCKEARLVQLAGQAEPYAFSFFSDIINHPSVSDAAQSVLDSIKTGMGALVRHLGEWHAEYKSLWGMKRVGVSVCVLCYVQYVCC